MDQKSKKTDHGQTRRNLAALLSETWEVITGFTQDDISTNKSNDINEPLNDIDAVAKIESGSFDKLDDNIDLQETLAYGGQGIVSKALDRKFNRIVALKSLNEEFKDNKEARRAFISEAMVNAQLDHPAIIPVYGIFEDNAQGLHLSMKLIRGKTLKYYLTQVCEFYFSLPHLVQIRRERKMIWKRLDVFLRVCEAISYVHHREVIHRDLKPENIMIGSFHETYVMDWGIAEYHANHTHNQNEKITGTLQYIAPEVINKQPFDHRSDIFLLGLILFEIVYLKPAFSKTPNYNEAVHKAQKCLFDPFTHQFGCKVDRDLKKIIEKALDPNPDMRYQSVKELENDIRSYSIGDEVKASPDGRIGKFIRVLRHRYKLLLGFCVLWLLLFTTVTSFALYQDINNRRVNHRRDRLMSQIYSQGIYSCNQFDRLFKEYEYLLTNIAHEASILLTVSPKEPARRWWYTLQDGQDPRTAPPGFSYSPAYGRNISFDNMLTVYPGAPEPPSAEIAMNMRQFYPIYKTLRKAVVNSLLAIANVDKTRIDDIIKYEIKPPMSIAFIGLENGFHAAYPFRTDYAPNYDTRERIWYKDAMKTPGQAAWGMPYVDTGEVRDIVISCSRTIDDADGKPIGAAGADIDLNSLLKFIRETGNIGSYVKNKFLVDKAGMVIADSNSNFNAIRTSTGELKFQSFPATDIFPDMWLKKNGWLFHNENGKNILYLYLEIKTLNWLYVERIDFKELMSSH